MSNFGKRLASMDMDAFQAKIRKEQEEEEREIYGRATSDPCQRCNNKRVARVFADGKDYSDLEIGEDEAEGYFPGGIGLGDGGGELDFAYCLDCGQIQGEFPIPEANVTTALSSMRGEYEEDEDD